MEQIGFIKNRTIMMRHISGRVYEVKQDIVFTLSNYDRLTIPKGFVVTFNKCPKFLSKLIKPLDNAYLADVIYHRMMDEKVINKNKRFYKDFKQYKKIALEERFIWRNDLSSKTPFKNWFTNFYLKYFTKP